MLTLPTITDHYEATLARRRRHVVLIKTIGAPSVNDHVCIRESVAGHLTDRRCYARVLFVETLTTGPLGPMHVLSIELIASSDRRPAIAEIPTPTPE